MLASFLFTDEKIFTVTTPKNPPNDRLYSHAYPSVKKKDVVTKRPRTQLAFGHWWHQSSSNKWLTLHQFDTCRSRSQGYWGVSVFNVVKFLRCLTSLILLLYCLLHGTNCGEIKVFITRNVMPLQQFLPATRRISSEFFSFFSAVQFPGAQDTWCNQLFLHNFVKCWAIFFKFKTNSVVNL